MTWLAEGTKFKFEVATDMVSGATQDIVIEVVTTAWTVDKQVKQLCQAMADARGKSDADRELTAVLSGDFDPLRRELERQHSLNPIVASVVEDVSAEVVSDRLDSFNRFALNPVSAQAYVLDAALSAWGYFLGNVQFHDPVPRIVPETPEELQAALAPWFEQLPHDEARDALAAAVRAAGQLEGAKCRELCELASISVPPPRSEPEK
jgi:hypothetical protein